MQKLCSTVLMLMLLVGCTTTTVVKQPYADKISKEREVEARVQIALIYLEENNPEQAISELRLAMDADPKSPRVHEILALALEQATDFKRADHHFKQMLRFDSSYTRGRANYASYLVRRGHCDAAYSHLKIVVDDIYYPRRAMAYQQMAECDRVMGNSAEMLSNYQKAIALDSRFAAPLLELAKIEFNNGNYPQSQVYFDQYRAKVDQTSAEGLLLGAKLARVFQDRDAEASFALALRNLYPRSQEYLDYLNLVRQ